MKLVGRNRVFDDLAIGEAEPLHACPANLFARGAKPTPLALMCAMHPKANGDLIVLREGALNCQVKVREDVEDVTVEFLLLNKELGSDGRLEPSKVTGIDEVKETMNGRDVVVCRHGDSPVDSTGHGSGQSRSGNRNNLAGRAQQG
jgi:hypothetical protein